MARQTYGIMFQIEGKLSVRVQSITWHHVVSSNLYLATTDLLLSIWTLFSPSPSPSSFSSSLSLSLSHINLDHFDEAFGMEVSSSFRENLLMSSRIIAMLSWWLCVGGPTERSQSDCEWGCSPSSFVYLSKVNDFALLSCAEWSSKSASISRLMLE